MFPPGGIVCDDLCDVVNRCMFIEAYTDFGVVNEGADADDVDVVVLRIGGDKWVADLVVGKEHGR